MLHYDCNKVEAAWETLTKKYLSKEIDGLIRISCTREVRNSSKAIFCFVGPAEDQLHCRTVGRKIIEVMQYTSQTCHFNFLPFLYYKVPRVDGYLYKEPF